MSPLLFIILLPLVAAAALAVVPHNYRVVHRAVPVATTCVAALLAVGLFWQFDPAVPGYQSVTSIPGLGAPSLGIAARFGVDGLNIGLILMGAIVAFAAACVCWEIREREKEFSILLLVMTGGILGAFASLDLFFFYFFHELALVPTFLMIGIWGRGEQRPYATFKITLYLSAGALIALVGLVALYVQSGANTFDLERLATHVRQNPISADAQSWIFPLLMFGFGILVSLWPFHTWAPIGYASAPTATAMLHAGVLKKFGLYGLIRVALPMLPDGARSWLGLLAVLCLGNILYCGLVAMRQRNLNWLLGNSSVAHMGFVFLGIASLNVLGITGALVLMVAHGLLAALSFGLSGHLHQKTGTLELSELGGLARQLPFIGTTLIMALLAGCGLPGFANFVGEVLVFFGGWKVYPGVTILACWGGLILGGVYMIRAIRAMLHGPLPERWTSLADAGPWRQLPFALLLASLLAFGLWPSLLTRKIEPAVSLLVQQIQAPRQIPPPSGPPELRAHAHNEAARDPRISDSPQPPGPEFRISSLPPADRPPLP